MTFQTNAPIETASLPISARPAREIARLVRDDFVELSPSYQRGSVWTTEQRIALVRSWLAGVPVPAVAINERRGNFGGAERYDGPVYAVIDGKQRIETAVAWFNGDLLVPASWFKAEDVLETEETEDGPYVRYTRLAKRSQLDLGFYAKLPVIETHVDSEAEEAALYVLLERSGVSQSAEDVARAERVAAGESV